MTSTRRPVETPSMMLFISLLMSVRLDSWKPNPSERANPPRKMNEIDMTERMSTVLSSDAHAIAKNAMNNSREPMNPAKPFRRCSSPDSAPEKKLREDNLGLPLPLILMQERPIIEPLLYVGPKLKPLPTIAKPAGSSQSRLKPRVPCQGSAVSTSVMVFG